MDNPKLIIHALKNAQTNTEKIATLMLLGKRLSNLSLDEEEKTTIFQLIDGQFLIESLKNYLENNDEYEFAIYIIAYFFNEIAKQTNRNQFIQIFCEILSVSQEKPSRIQQEVVETILDCFDYICSNLSLYDEVFLFELFFNNLIIKCYTPGNELECHISNIIISLIRNSNNNENVEKFMEKICQFFVSDKSEKKFHLCKLIGIIIRDGPWNHQQIVIAQWIPILRDEIFILFQNRLPDKLRNSIINLSTELIMKFEGLDWIKLKRWEAYNSKFFILLLKLIVIELEITWSHTNWPQLINGEVEHYTQCLVIFEHIFFTLIKNVDLNNVPDDDQLKLNADEIVDSIDTIQRTVSQLIHFLLKAFAESMDSQAEIKQIIISSFRFLCLYAKEESETFRNEIDHLKPFIIKFLEQNDPEIQKLRNLINNITFN